MAVILQGDFRSLRQSSNIFSHACTRTLQRHRKNLNQLLAWFESLIVEETFRSNCGDVFLKEATQQKSQEKNKRKKRIREGQTQRIGIPSEEHRCFSFLPKAFRICQSLPSKVLLVRSQQGTPVRSPWESFSQPSALRNGHVTLQEAAPKEEDRS